MGYRWHLRTVEYGPDIYVEKDGYYSCDGIIDLLKEHFEFNSSNCCIYLSDDETILEFDVAVAKAMTVLLKDDENNRVQFQKMIDYAKMKRTNFISLELW